MKIEREIKLTVTLTDEETSVLNWAKAILSNLEREMVNNHCDTILCTEYEDDYTYDISNLREIIRDLEQFTNIAEVFN